MDPTVRPLDVVATAVLFLAFLIVPPTASAAPVSVNLAPVANVTALVKDGSAVPNGGLDTFGDAYSANLTGTSVAFSGSTFGLGTPGVADAASSVTVALPAGNFASVQLLATAVSGNQTNQTFVVNYTDGSHSSIVRSLSDWFTPQGYADESIALTMPYRLKSTGAQDGRTFRLYGYALPIDSTKVVRNISLPNNRKVVVLAIDLLPAAASPTVSVSLSLAANVHALSNDGSAVAGGGLDGSGDAYSANLTGSSISWQGINFTLGAAGVADAVTRSTVSLPAGNYSTVELLAAAVHGNQPNQSFVVNYTDGTSKSFVQGVSDWATPQHYPGEAIVLSMPYRLTASGAKDMRTFYIYGYSLSIDGSKTIKSITLPNNANVVVLSIVLIRASSVATIVCNPLTFGAVADGKTDNTQAIQSAIDSCFSKQGGTVELSASGNSVYLSGPVSLKSHVHLQVDAGVTLQGTNDHSRYVPAYLNWVYEPNEALVSAQAATDVGITGAGIIDGAGASWWALKSTEGTGPGQVLSARPYLVEFYQCDHVTVTGVTLRNSPVWTQVFRFSDTITESDTTISAPGTSPNTDGLDLVGATHVVLTNLNIATGDDSIAVKSGLPINTSDPRQVGLPHMATAHVQISNVTISGGHGLSIGSEASNGVNDVTVQAVTFTGAGNGVRLKTNRTRGSQIFGITFKDIKMSGVGIPIILDDYYQDGNNSPTDGKHTLTSTTPYVHDITIQNLTATGANGQSTIDGLPESCMNNIVLDNVSIQTSAAGMILRHVTGSFNDVTVTPGAGPPFVVQPNVSVATSGTTPPIPVTPALSNQTPCASQIVP